MCVLTPARLLQDHPIAGNARPVLALVDQAKLSDPALDHAVAVAIWLAAPLEVVLLHPRLGPTTDAAVAAEFHARLDAARWSVAAVVHDHLAGQALPFRVSLHPYARRPFRDPRGQARRAADALLRAVPAQAVHLTRDLC